MDRCRCRGGLAIAAALLWRRSPPPAPVARLAIALPEDVSPDPGRVLGAPGDLARWDDRGADVRKRNRRRYLVLRRLDSDTFRRVPGTDGARQAFWSPDSRHIGFFAGTTLKRVPLAGGEPVTLCEVGFSRGGAWSRCRHHPGRDQLRRRRAEGLGERWCTGSRDPSGPGSRRELAPVSRVPAGRQSVPLLRADRARRESRRVSGVAG